MTASNHHQFPDTMRDDARAFVLWMLEALGLHVQATSHGVYQVTVPAASSADSGEADEHPYSALAGKRFTFCGDAIEHSESPEPIECVTWQSPLMQWLLGELHEGKHWVHGAAARQPQSVHELTEHLFTQYKVDNGHVHLAGCSLEDRPFLRLTYLQDATSDETPQIVQCYGTSDGDLVDPALSESLELDELVPVVNPVARINVEVVRRWSELIRHRFQTVCNAANKSLLAVTIVWCKYAEGKLTFTIGGKSVEVSFSGWGKMFANRRCLPPPYHCPLTGRSSYHLVATDDGRITVAEAIATCAESSRRVLASELEQCAVTQRMVLPEYLRECPCSGERLLASALETCSWCQQPVSPHALVEGRCCACRQLSAVAPADPGLERLLTTYPELRRLRNWKKAETAAVQIFLGSTVWKRLLIVCKALRGESDSPEPERQLEEVLHVAVSGRLSSTWTGLNDEQRARWLRR